jgi:hypothetical protein
MVPKPRKELISLEATPYYRPYYHCVSRCVRKAFLCGTDSSGRSLEHRRDWIDHLLIEQAKAFCIHIHIDIAAYAVMSNKLPDCHDTKQPDFLFIPALLRIGLLHITARQ